MLSTAWIGIRGAVRHSAAWVGASFSSVEYKNPKFVSRPEWEGSELERGIGVYCVHGTADRTSSFDHVARHLLPNLPPEVSSIHLPAFQHRAQGAGIEDYAEQLARIIKKNGHTSVVLMGHSRGGLIASYLTEYLAEKYGITVLQVYTMGTPYGGSSLAMPPLNLISQSVKQMETNSPFLKELSARVRRSSVPYINFAAEYDGLVALKDTFVDNDERLPFVLRRHNHLSMMFSQSMINHIQSRLPNCCPQLLTTPSQTTVALDEKKQESKIEDEFEVVDEQPDASLSETYYEVDCQIESLASHIHLQSSATKVKVLHELQKKLWYMLENNDRGEAYSEAKTIGEFISAFMSDTKVFSEGKPMDLLAEQLNYPLTLFSSSAPSSQQFVTTLIQKYSKAPLPEKQKLAPALQL